MKRLLLYILLLLVSLSSSAQPQQMKHSIEIDASSFRPVNTNPLTGVAIDKIERDNSLRPCARIKLRINRMTRADIEGLQVKVLGGIHDVMKRVVAHEGNGLIIELTAKPQTRFYLHHDKYGDSNEVTLNLEGDKEYRLDAELCHLQSIVVETNYADADVYVDDMYQGKTSASKRLTVENILHGPHKIRVANGTSSQVLDVEVSSTSIHFVVNLPIADVSPQYLVLKVMPADAKVLINGKQQPYFERGVIHALLDPGTYSYTISAKDYHDESGTFVIADSKVEQTIRLRPAYGWVFVDGDEEVRGAKVYVNGRYIGTAPLKSDRLPSGKYTIRIDQKLYKSFEDKIIISDNETLNYSPSLVADFANVTLSADDDSDVYINGQWRGKGGWKGKLSTGAYTFEARKKNHHSASITQTITAEHRYQSYTIPSPTPIMCTVIVNTKPASANVYIDDKYAGTTPFESKLFEGRYKISIRKEGFDDVNQYVSVEEHQTYRLSPALVPQPQSVVFYVTPAKAEVMINGRIYNTDEDGVVELILSNGSYEYAVLADDYHSEKGAFDVYDKKMEVRVKLRPTFGWLTVGETGALSGASVYVDGEFIGKAPVKKIRVSSGAHRVRIVKKYYKDYEGKAVVNDGEIKIYSPSLEVDYNNKPRKVGFGSIVNFSSSIGFGGAPSSLIGASYIAGYRFNDYIYMGGGVGVGLNAMPSSGNRYLDYTYSANYLNLNKFSVPLFLYMQANFSHRRCSPYFAIAGGGRFSGKQNLRLDLCDVKYRTLGAFVNPQIGVNFRANSNTDLLFAVGFQCYNTPICVSYTGYSATFKSAFACGVNVHLGVAF